MFYICLFYFILSIIFSNNVWFDIINNNISVSYKISLLCGTFIPFSYTFFSIFIRSLYYLTGCTQCIDSHDKNYFVMCKIVFSTY